MYCVTNYNVILCLKLPGNLSIFLGGGETDTFVTFKMCGDIQKCSKNGLLLRALQGEKRQLFVTLRVKQILILVLICVGTIDVIKFTLAFNDILQFWPQNRLTLFSNTSQISPDR